LPGLIDLLGSRDDSGRIPFLPVPAVLV
jgi:hypothetical protein